MPLEQRLTHRVAPRGIVDRRAQVDARGQQVVDVQAEIHALDVVGGTRQQARADEERQRQRQLRADEEAARAAAAPPADRAATLFLQRRGGVGRRRLPRRQQPEEQRGSERCSRRGRSQSTRRT